MFSLGYCEETIAMMELSLCDGIGPVVGKHLIQQFGDARSVFLAHKSDWQGKSGIQLKLAHQLQMSKDNGCKAARELAETHKKLSIRATAIHHSDYPYRLKELANAPLVLYSKGEIPWNAPRILGVVGTRKPTPQGAALTKEWIEQLATFNIAIVSGLAYGIDIIAHKTALQSQIPNFAVLAHGVDHIYPTTHKNTALQMIEHGGGLLSDFPANTKMHPDYFPKRNRIVAGLCDALLVVESGVKGGSMITASIAHGYNREVFAVPGRPTDLASQGCNFLIKQHMAHLAREVNDITEVMGWSNGSLDSGAASSHENQLTLFDSLNPIEKQVMQWLIAGIQKPDDMLQQSGWSASNLAMALLDLELKGLITAQAGNFYTARC
jgi:DNA processing protein